jgi:uracil-DNA glycosylase family 4
MNGEGSKNPTWLFVGEAPGREEDDEGYPFAGESGSELRQSIEDAGIPIDKCRFTNVVRCRPPENNLSKFPNAIAHCRPHILREIRATGPKVVVLIGNSAIKSILNRSGILKLHGQVIDIGRLKYVCMFHPAYLLRNNTPATRKSFLDALRVAKRAATSRSIHAKSDRVHTTILDRKMLQEAVDAIKKCEYPATDIEASTLSPFSRKAKAETGVIGVADTNEHSWEFPVHARVGLKGCKLRPEEVLEGVKEVWEYPGLKWLVWNGIYDVGYVGVKHNIWLGGKGHKTGAYFDGMLASYALNELRGLHGLDKWCGRVDMPSYDQMLEQYKLTNPEARANYNLIPTDILYPYNGDDCIATRRLFFYQRKKLKAEGLFEKPLMFPLMPISWICMMMQVVGIKASEKRNSQLDVLYRDRISKLDEKLYSYPEIKQLQKEADEKSFADAYEHVQGYKKKPPNFKAKVFEIYKKNKKPINLNSPDIRRKLLFEVLEYESLDETDSGLDSVKRWIIEELQQKHKSPILKRMIERGKYSSAHSKYILPLPTKWIGTDNRVHGSHLPHGTRTGRPSCQDPNMYNLPARSSLTDELMSQFVPSSERNVIVKQDSKQIELRLMADRAKDKVMIAEFMAGEDPHAKGAQAAFEYTEKRWNKLPAEKQKELRSYSKNAVSFGLVYGRDAKALAADFGWSLQKAEEFKSRYFGKYHGIAAYLEAEQERIRKDCLSVSHYNRHRRLPEAADEDIGRANHAIREGINAPIQGDASDINLIAAYRMQHWLLRNQMKTRVINYVYDAVYLDAYRKELRLVVPKLHFYMSDRKYLLKTIGWKLNVPLDTDCAIGDKNMGDMVELEHTKIPGQFIIPKQFLQ